MQEKLENIIFLVKKLENEFSIRSYFALFFPHMTKMNGSGFSVASSYVICPGEKEDVTKLAPYKKI